MTSFEHALFMDGKPRMDARPMIDRPSLILRLEGALVFAAATFAYGMQGAGWLLYALLFFTPDIFMLGYLRNAVLGARIYNVGHSYLLPAALFIGGFILSSEEASAAALIWLAHIGFDRTVGYGLKYVTGFKHTHLTS